MIQIVDGKLRYNNRRKSFILEAVQTIIMPANIPHAVKAVEI